MPLKIRPNAIEQDQGDFIFPGVISLRGNTEFSFDADGITGSSQITARDTSSGFKTPISIHGSVVQMMANDGTPAIRIEEGGGFGKIILNPISSDYDLEYRADDGTVLLFGDAGVGTMIAGGNAPLGGLSGRLHVVDGNMVIAANTGSTSSATLTLSQENAWITGSTGLGRYSLAARNNGEFAIWNWGVNRDVVRIKEGRMSIGASTDPFAPFALAVIDDRDYSNNGYGEFVGLTLRGGPAEDQSVGIYATENEAGTTLFNGLVMNAEFDPTSGTWSRPNSQYQGAEHIIYATPGNLSMRAYVFAYDGSAPLFYDMSIPSGSSQKFISFNPLGDDIDFTVRDDAINPAIHMQASDGFVGFNTNTPGRRIHILEDNELFLRLNTTGTSTANQIEYLRGDSFTWLGPTAGNEFHLWSQENINFVMGLNNGEVMRVFPTGIHFNDADAAVAFKHFADDGSVILSVDPTYNKVLIGNTLGYWNATVPTTQWGPLSIISDNVAMYPGVSLEKYNNTAYYPILQTRISRGTRASPTPPTVGQTLFSMTNIGYDGHFWRNGFTLSSSTDEAWTSGSQATQLNLAIAPLGGGTLHSMMFHQSIASGWPAGTSFNSSGAENMDFTIFASGSSGGNPTNPAFKVICGTGEVQIDTSGLTIPSSVTGGDKGQGTINVTTDIYKANSAYGNPDFVLEHYYRGEIVQFADKPGADQYQGLMPLPEVDAYLNENLHLPQIARGPMGMFDRGDALLLHLEQVYLYLIEQEKRLRDLENLNGGEKDFQ